MWVFHFVIPGWNTNLLINVIANSVGIMQTNASPKLLFLLLGLITQGVFWSSWG